MFARSVKIDGRSFTAIYDGLGKPVRIKERKLFFPGKPWECYGDTVYWSAKHHKVPKKSTSIVARILAATLHP